jgi:hypothetical protein
VQNQRLAWIDHKYRFVLAVDPEYHLVPVDPPSNGDLVAVDPEIIRYLCSESRNFDGKKEDSRFKRLHKHILQKLSVRSQSIGLSLACL